MWLYEAEKIQSSQSLTSGQYIAMTKDANGNYVGEAGNKATIRVNESQNKAAYPMAATIEENAVLTFAAPRAGTISVAETAARLDGWNPADFDGAGLSVYKDGERIWPAEGDNPVVTDTPVTVPALPDIAVEAGDKLRFVVDIGRVGGTQWGDTVICRSRCPCPMKRAAGRRRVRPTPPPHRATRTGRTPCGCTKGKPCRWAATSPAISPP